MQLVKPYNLFWAGSALLFVAWGLIRAGDRLDLHLHDTYYVVSLKLVCMAFLLLFLLYGVFYRLAAPVLPWPALTWFHAAVTVLTGMIAVGASIMWSRSSQDLKFINFDFWNTVPSALYVQRGALVLLLLFLVAQASFLFQAVLVLSKFVFRHVAAR